MARSGKREGSEGSVSLADEQGERRERVDREPGTVAPGTMSAVRDRQREEFGGISWGACFFGWLAAAGLAAILAGIVGASGAALALNEVGNDVSDGEAETIGLAGGIALLAVLAIAYFCGGYVAGRMSRFDGFRQGVGVWLWGIIIALLVAALALIGGSEYNVLESLNLPRIPVDQGSLTTGGIIALAAALLVTLLAAILGGKLGERFHRKVDRTALA